MTDSVEIEVRIAWWFRLYVIGVTIMCFLLNCEPDEEKSLYWAGKALRVTINGMPVRAEVDYGDH